MSVFRKLPYAMSAQAPKARTKTDPPIYKEINNIMKRKTVLAIALAVLLIVLLSATTVAYFTTEKAARNRIASGAVTVEIVEKDGEAKKKAATSQVILPGDTVEKTVAVENVDNHPAWIRAKVVVGVENSELSAEECLLMNIDTEHWTEKDGWYYYNRALEKGETTEPLFTEVHFDGKAIDNQYLGKSFTLNITVKAVQSENNGKTVFDASGWPAD